MFFICAFHTIGAAVFVIDKINFMDVVKLDGKRNLVDDDAEVFDSSGDSDTVISAFVQYG